MSQITQVQMPDVLLQRVRPYPPFPMRFLKGIPVFWDDFEHHIAGFLPQDKGAQGMYNSIVPFGTAQGGWTWGDGSEYGVYVTSEAAHLGKQSLRIGGPSTVTYASSSNDQLQDVSCSVMVPSKIIGIEFDILWAGQVGPTNGPLLSIEKSDFVNSTTSNFIEDQVIWESFRWLVAECNTPCIVLNPVPTQGAKNFILTGSITGGSAPAQADSNGLYLPNTPLTVPTPSTIHGFVKGSGTAWHHCGAVCNMNTRKYLDIYFDKYYINTRSASNNLPKSTAYTHQNQPSYQEEGLFRVELHNGDQTFPMYIDNLVVTDEGGFVSP